MILKRIGILGGTFNPPHIGHFMIANEVYHQMKLDEIWFMPNNIPPHKKQDLTVTNENRKEMLELICKDIPYFRIETYEMDRNEVSYTVETMRHLTKVSSDVQFYFIIGGDMIEYLPKFKGIEELSSLVQFIGVTREGYETSSPYQIHLVDMPTIAISSSFIRERVKNNRTIKFMVPEAIENYIKEKHLYES